MHISLGFLSRAGFVRLSSLVPIAALALSAAGAFAQAPTNDMFANAQVISGANGTVGGTNVGATRESGEPSHTYYLGPNPVPSTVWYAWTVPQSGAITINTNGSSFPAVLAVYEGATLDALAIRATGYAPIFDSGFGGNSVTFIARAGTILRIAVGSVTASCGLIQLNWQTNPAPANDDFANAQIITGNSGTVTGSNTSATGELNEPSHYSGGGGTTASSVWYRWTPTQSGTVVFDTTGSHFFELLAIYTGPSLGQLAAMGYGEASGFTPASITLQVTAGTTYSIAVASHYDNRGSITLNWAMQTAPIVITPPANQVATIGGTATFTAVVSGGGLSYQWFHDGVAIAGATNATLNLSNLALADAGTYYIRASNLNGVTISPAAVLTGAHTAPTISTQPQGITATAGQPATLNVVAAGMGPFVYQWRRNGVSIAGATGARYTLANATRGDADFYDVIVYDGLSATTSQLVPLAVEPSKYPGLLARIAGNDFVPETSVADPVSLIVSGPGGKIYIAGSFKAIGGHWRSGLARLSADLSLDLGFTPPVIQGTINAIVPLDDGRLWLAGQFTAIDGADRGIVVRLNADGSVDTTFSAATSGFGGAVSAMAVMGDGRLLLGGSFVKNSISSPLAVMGLDGLANIITPPATLGNTIYAITAQSDGKILVGGEAPYNQAPSGNGIARFNSDGTIDSTFLPVDVALDIGSVSNIAVQTDGRILVAGNFSNYSNIRIKRLLPTGALDPTFSANAGISPNGSVKILALQSDGKIVVGGQGLFSSNGNAINIARLNVDGSVDSSFARPLNINPSSAVVLPSGALLTGGSLGPARIYRLGLSKLSSDGTLDASLTLTPRQVGSISAMADLPGGAVLAAGNFNYLAGVPAANVARIDSNGSVSPTFNSGQGSNGPIYNIVPQSDGREVLFGNFSTYAGVARSGIARINADGSLDASYNVVIALDQVSPCRAVGRCVRLSRDRMLFATNLSTWAGAPVKGLIALNPDGTRDNYFDVGTGANGDIYTFAPQLDGKVLVGGYFTTFNGQGRNQLVRLNADGSLDNSFDAGTGPNGFVNAIAVLPDGRILIEGSFTAYNGVARKFVARLNTGGSLDTSFVPPDADAGADGAVVQGDGRVIVYGNFTAMGTGANSSYIARLNSDGTRDLSFQTYGLTARVTSLLFRGDGQLYAGSGTDGLVRFASATVPAIAVPPTTTATTAGANVQFTVTATGTLPLTYQWFFNDVPIVGATASSLALANVQLANVGRYTVSITNEFGSVTSDGVLLKGPNPLPIIATQPNSMAAAAGQNVTFNVNATAVGVASYQWRRAGLPIAGATTATLNLGPASLIQNGAIYDVVVNDGLSVTVSRPVTVSVTPTSYPQTVRADPTFTPSFDVLGGDIKKFVRGTGGRVYVAGLFSRLGGVRAWNIARLTTAGAVDPSFAAPAADGPINTAEEQSDGKLIIGGSFTRIDGKSLGGLARFNSDGSLDDSFVPGDNYSIPGVYALRVQADGRILVGGGFTVGSGLVRVNSDGSRDATFANAYLTGYFYDIAMQPDGKIVAGGSFSGPNGLTFNRLARLNSDGSLDTTFNTGNGTSSMVKVVRVLSDGRVLVAGHFSSFNGVVAGRIVRLTSAGAIDPTWGAGTGFSSADYSMGVEAIEVQPDGKILAVGSFSSFNGTNRFQVARLTSDGALDASFVPAFPTGGANAISYFPDGSVIVGGSVIGNINVLTNTGTVVNNSLNGTLFSPAAAIVRPLPAGKFMAAGVFTHVNGVARQYIARLNADGTLDATFSNAGTGPSWSVNDMMIQPDGRAVIAGSFDGYNGVAQPYIARINDDGSLDTTFHPAANGYHPQNGVQVCPLTDGRMLVYSQNNAFQPYFLRLNADGSTAASFAAPSVISTMSTVSAAAELADGSVVLVGSFGSFSGTPAGLIIRLLPNGTLHPSFSSAADNNVNTVVVQPDGKILIGGDFLAINGTPCPRLARLNPDGTLDPGFHPGVGPNATVRKILLQADGRLLVNGWFTAVDGAPNTAFLARLLADGTMDATFAALRINGAPSSLEMQDDGSLLLSGGYGQVGSYLQYGVVRTVTTGAPAFTAQPQPVMALVGDSATFSASASGTGIAYQWYKNGAAILGATNATYTIAQVQAVDAGSYTVTVTNFLGNVTSAAATLTVNLPSPPRRTP
jgi:uncharacterized delta-60 repeat protein